jgi:hypothetical protein
MAAPLRSPPPGFLSTAYSSGGTGNHREIDGFDSGTEELPR